jgi:ferredoxin
VGRRRSIWCGGVERRRFHVAEGRIWGPMEMRRLAVATRGPRMPQRGAVDSCTTLNRSPHTQTARMRCAQSRHQHGCPSLVHKDKGHHPLCPLSRGSFKLIVLHKAHTNTAVHPCHTHPTSSSTLQPQPLSPARAQWAHSQLWRCGGAQSKWGGPAEETRALFVDEMTCIGCKNCVWQAPATFRIEPDYGRSQVTRRSAQRFPEVREARTRTCVSSLERMRSRGRSRGCEGSVAARAHTLPKSHRAGRLEQPKRGWARRLMRDEAT